MATLLEAMATPDARRQLQSFARRFDRHEAEDLVQETLLRLCEGRDRFREECEPMTYAGNVLRNVWRDRGRRRIAVMRRRPHLDDSPEAYSWAARREAECAESVSQRVRAALAEIEPRLARLLRMQLDGYRYQDIARRFRTPINTVRTRLLRARAQLREVLEDEWRDGDFAHHRSRVPFRDHLMA